MSNDRIQKLRDALKSDVIVLQEYNNFRSTRPGKKIFAFEGYDDVVFYEVMLSKSGYSENIEAFVCKGKDKVLNLREILGKNKSKDSNNVLYFIDHDFDGMKSHRENDNTYCTDVYSIENYISTPEVILKILNADFRCNDDASNQELKRGYDFFENASKEFYSAMYDVNLILYYARQNNLQGTGIDNNIDKYVKISIEKITKKCNTSEIIKHLGLEKLLDNKTLEEIKIDVENKFCNLDPQKDWRGKYNLSFFQKILKILLEDRNSKNPRIFKNKKLITAKFDGNIVRQLSSACLLPKSLKSFAEKNSLCS